MNEFKDALRKYAVFNGRASQRDYWMYQLVLIALLIVVMVLAVIGGDSIVGKLFNLIYIVVALGTLVPGLAVGARRLHDVDKSGWWLLLSAIPLANLYLLYLLIIRGTPGPNRFGLPVERTAIEAV